MSTEFQYDVFLSHNAADKPRVRRLAERLRAPCSQPSTFNYQPTRGLERNTVLFRDPANAGRRFIPLLPFEGEVVDMV
jgi:hypothetical protein